MEPDPILVAAGIGVFVSPAAGGVLLRGLEQRVRNGTQTAVTVNQAGVPT
jgi:hypothetical protein